MTAPSHSNESIFFDFRHRDLIRLFNCFVWSRFVTTSDRFSSETLQRIHLERNNANHHNSEGCFFFLLYIEVISTEIAFLQNFVSLAKILQICIADGELPFYLLFVICCYYFILAPSILQ